jgi:SAM-dependent methyltransferase
MSGDFQALIKTAILDEATFIRAVFRGQRRGEVVPWPEVELRPVLIKNERHLQLSYIEDKQHITKNFREAAVAAQIEVLLQLPFKNYRVERSTGNFHVQLTKKGKAIIHREKGQPAATAPNLAHDRSKNYLLNGPESRPFLQAVGIMARNGQIIAAMQRKLRQINEFLKLVDDSLAAATWPAGQPLQVVDFGCGSGTLTFAMYHYLAELRGLPTHLTGVDLKTTLIEKLRQTGQALDWSTMTFRAGRIIDFQPEQPAQIVLALHACDTATDEALAQAIAMHSDYIFCAPCCHHHLQQQLRQQPTPPPFGPVLRHGILRERMGDILTDALRALILGIMGYKTEIIEFVSSDHTAKNLMIRAVKSGPTGDPASLAEYQALKAWWQVEPYLEEILGERLRRYLAQ